MSSNIRFVLSASYL